MQTDCDLETTWKGVLRICSENAMTFKITSKSEGIITAQKTHCKLTYLKSNKIVDSTSWIVAERVKQNAGNNYYNPTMGTVDWHILLSPNNNGTIVIVSHTSPILVTHTKMPGFVEKRREYKSIAFSTGTFERRLKEELCKI